MTFGSAISNVLSNYANFSGRASKSEFWWWFLFFTLLMIAVGMVSAVLSDSLGGLLSGLVWLGLFLPNLAVHVRRLHDTGHSGWWLLIFFIPLIGFIVLLVWFLSASTPLANSYGEPPKQFN
jgi:uncharacterized membrane protein YhaH (DUF805 family)